MFGKKKSQKIDLGFSQLVALQHFFKVYEVLHGYDFEAPDKVMDKDIKLVSQEPTYNVTEVWPTLLSEMRFTDRAEFGFEFQGIEYRIILKHHWRWFPVGCEILGPDFKASAKSGYCSILKHQCVVIHCEELDSGKKWHIKGTSATHRIKATPEEFKRADVGSNVDAERARLRELHRI